MKYSLMFSQSKRFVQNGRPHKFFIVNIQLLNPKNHPPLMPDDGRMFKTGHEVLQRARGQLRMRPHFEVGPFFFHETA